MVTQIQPTVYFWGSDMASVRSRGTGSPASRLQNALLSVAHACSSLAQPAGVVWLISLLVSWRRSQRSNRALQMSFEQGFLNRCLAVSWALVISNVGFDFRDRSFPAQGAARRLAAAPITLFWVLFWICIHFDGPKKERLVSPFDKWNYVDTDERAATSLRPPEEAPWRVLPYRPACALTAD